jgi:hypothetical protein
MTLSLSDARSQHAVISQALAQLRQGELGMAAFSGLAQSQTALIATLPARYGEVLEQLLNRLESSALFTEESCSFSQADLLDSAQLWLDKAHLELTKT